MELRSLLGRPGFKQAIAVDAKGIVDAATASDRLTLSEIQTIDRACARLGAALGLGALTDLASESPGDASLFVVHSEGALLAAVFAPVGDGLDDRIKEIHKLANPQGLLSRHMGFAEIRR